MRAIQVLSKLGLLGAVAILGFSSTAAGKGRHKHHRSAHHCGDRLYVPPPNPDALKQIKKLVRARDYGDALLVGKMLRQPSAVWFNGDATPDQVRKDVAKTIRDARRQKATPVLVAYNLPFRDCAQFSAGGATTVDEYLEWIDGFAAGIGDSDAIVILEPDGLGIIPYYEPITSPGSYEWCQPAEADEATAAADRFFMLNAAVDRLGEQSGALVYLDGTHNGWLGSGDAAHRLVQAGVERAAGFFLNASNYQETEALTKYGEWISSCIAFGTNEEEGGWRMGHFDWCASQYYPASPDDPTTWSLSDDWYAGNLGTAVPSAGFVIDTSRNGQGKWTPPEDHPEGDPQDWCNPPDRGLGLRPSLDVDHDLVDAYLWIKIPGESDGECNRWEPAGSADPVRGVFDPPAGQWFSDMALELVHNANPPLGWW